MVEEVLHIAVNTPQIYEVPKTQRSRLLAILQSYLQKRVMQFLQGCSDDPEELSHRQLEANRFRSTVMKQVYQLLREEQEREMSMSSTVVNGFEYYFKENANPFNDLMEKRWNVDKIEEIEVTPIRDEFEAKRKRINDEYLDSLIRYNKAMLQRNTLLKSEVEPEPELMNVWEEMMASSGEIVSRAMLSFR